MSSTPPSVAATEAELRARVAFLESRVASLERELAQKSPARAATTSLGHSGNYEHHHHAEPHTPHHHRGGGAHGGVENSFAADSPSASSQSGRTVTRHRFSHQHQLHHGAASHPYKHPYSVGGGAAPHHRSPHHPSGMRHSHWAHSPGGPNAHPPTPPCHPHSESDPRTLGGVVGGTLGVLSPMPAPDLPGIADVDAGAVKSIFASEPGGRLGGDAATMSPNTAVTLGINKKLHVDELAAAAAGDGHHPTSAASMGGASASSPLNSPSPGAAVAGGGSGGRTSATPRKSATTADVAAATGELPPALLVETGSPLLQRRDRTTGARTGAPLAASDGGAAVGADAKAAQFAPAGFMSASGTFCSLLPPPPPGVPPVAVEFIEPGLQAHRNRSFGVDLRRHLLDTWRAEDHPEDVE